MAPLNIGGLEVEFPFPPYECQLTFMEAVIDALRTSRHALLESPTGTGKTLCLLTAALAWRAAVAAVVEAAPRKGLSGGIPAAQLRSLAAAAGVAADATGAASEAARWLCGGSGGSGGSGDVGSGGGGGGSQPLLPPPPSSTPGGRAVPRIVYASRTHSQLSQVVAELKTARLRPRMVLLGSREQLCVHPHVSTLRGGTQNAACASACASKTCSFKAPFDAARDGGGVGGAGGGLAGNLGGSAELADHLIATAAAGPMDIEELVAYGSSHRVCPYYLAREAAADAELLLMPYNYVIDPGTWSATGGSDLSGDVLVIDEAHNLPGVCAEFMSFDWTAGQRMAAVRELQRCYEMALTGGGGGNGGRRGGGIGAPRNGSDAAPIMLTPSFGGGGIPGDSLGGSSGGGGGDEAATTWRALRTLVKDMDAAINRTTLSPNGTLVKPADYLRTFLSEHCLTAESAAETAERLGRAARMVSDSPTSGAAAGIHALLGVLRVAFADEEGLFADARGTTHAERAEAFQAFLEATAKLEPVDGGGGGGTARSPGGWLASTRPPQSGNAAGPPSRGGSGDGASCSGGSGGASARPGPPPTTAFRTVFHRPPPSERGGDAGNTLSFWCFDPSISMRLIARRGVRCILLASGTLSPMDAVEAELGLPFPVRVENPHVITPPQILSLVVPVGPSGGVLNSSYATRSTFSYRMELGRALANFSRVIPGGLLVFFPSYAVLDGCVSFWQTTRLGSSGGTMWSALNDRKAVLVETRAAGALSELIATHAARTRAGDGSAIYAVCRGKVSEGIDFADADARAVLITGLPYPAATDPKVVLKKQAVDAAAVAAFRSRAAARAADPACAAVAAPPALTATEWYAQQASRAVNQAAGRAIRHVHDYGAVVFLDERFAAPAAVGRVSAWLRPHLRVVGAFPEAQAALARFFRAAAVAPFAAAGAAKAALRAERAAAAAAADTAGASRLAGTSDRGCGLGGTSSAPLADTPWAGPWASADDRAVTAAAADGVGRLLPRRASAAAVQAELRRIADVIDVDAPTAGGPVGGGGVGGGGSVAGPGAAIAGTASDIVGAGGPKSGASAGVVAGGTASMTARSRLNDLFRPLGEGASPPVALSPARTAASAVPSMASSVRRRHPVPPFNGGPRGRAPGAVAAATGAAGAASARDFMDEVLAAVGRRARRRVLTLLREVRGHLAEVGAAAAGAAALAPGAVSVTSASPSAAGGATGARGGARGGMDTAYLRERMHGLRAVFHDSSADAATVASLLRRLETWMPPSTRQLYRETGAVSTARS